MVRAGTYRDRVRIERFVEGTDASGGPARIWEPITEVPDGEVNCQIMEVGPGQEFHGAGTEVAENRTRIRIREVPGLNVDPAMRLVDVDRETIYEIESILPSRLRDELILRCQHGGTVR